MICMNLIPNRDGIEGFKKGEISDFSFSIPEQDYDEEKKELIYMEEGADNYFFSDKDNETIACGEYPITDGNVVAMEYEFKDAFPKIMEDLGVSKYKILECSKINPGTTFIKGKILIEELDEE